MVPAALFGRRGLLLGQRGPDAEMAIGDGAAPRFQAPRPQIPQHRPPRLLRFALAALDGQHDLPSICERPDHHEERRLGLLQASFHIQTIRPDVHHLQVIKPLLLPHGILVLPLRLEPLK